jgi:hypothetical protein
MAACLRKAGMPIDAKTLFCAVFLPAFIALAALWADAWLGRRGGRGERPDNARGNATIEAASASAVSAYAPARRRRWDGLIGAAFAVAFCVAMPCVIGVSPWQLRSGWQVLFPVAAGMAFLSVVLGFAGGWTRIAGVALAAVAAVAAVSWQRFSRTGGWTPMIAVGWVALAALPLIAGPLALRLVQTRRGAIAPAWTLAATAMLGSAAIGFLGHSATLAQLALAPAAMAGATALFVTYFRFATLPLTAWATLVVLSGGLVVAALEPWFGDMPLRDGVPLLIAPVAALAALWGVRERRYAATLIALLAVLACCGVTIARMIETALIYRDDGYL